MARRVASFIALALSARIASAHYIFQQLSVGGTTYPTFQYIRKNSNYNSPVTELSSPDLRCNVGASGSGTATIAVNAGASFTFTLDTPVYHQGPISIYLSKAPGAAADYDGSGGWFKIKDFGPTFSSGSSTWPMSGSYTYTLPTCLANGDYLLRIQSLAIHNPWPAGIPQFYISCAQITVSGGSGTLNPSTVSIPGTFKETDPGYTANIYSNFNSYTVPGPAPVACGSGGGGDPPVTTTARTTLATTTRTSAAPTTTQNTNCAALYGQCGGNGWTGPTCCSSGTCKKSNDFYSQCL